MNIYKSGDKPEAYLMDMRGNIVHKWAAGGPDDTWSNIELLRNGDLIAIVDYERLVRLDEESNIVWASDRLGFHHDIAEAGNGALYTLRRKNEYLPDFSRTHLTANDYITILDGAGRVEKSVSIAGLLLDAGIPIVHEDIDADYPRVTVLARIARWLEVRLGRSLLVRGLKWLNGHYERLTRPKDYIHANTIVIIDEAIAASTNGLFGAGDILICVRNQNLIALVDMQKEEIVWSWGGGVLEHPHDPVVMRNGNLLIFDNGHRRAYSRIVELNPGTRDIEWEYRSTPPEQFYSETRGSNQQLPNGNILIADSRNGRAFEVTRDGETVWEFHNPDVRTEQGEDRRATIFRMRRITSGDPLPRQMLPDGDHR
jgi:hypothetical protein